SLNPRYLVAKENSAPNAPMTAVNTEIQALMSFGFMSEEPFSSVCSGSSGSLPSSGLVGSTLLEEPKLELPLGAWGVEVSVVVTSSAAATEVPAKERATAAAPATSALREKSF